MEQISYRVGDLRRMIKESADEFNAKIGSGVIDANKRNNEKSYKDAEKAAKDFDGGLKPEDKGTLPDKEDYNRTTLDYNPIVSPDKDYKDRIEAQAKGYTSKLEEENGIEKAAEFDNDGKIMKQFKKASDKINKQKVSLATSGIQGNNLKNEIDNKKNTMYENTKPVAKRLNFKHSNFINESKVLSLIPENYKRDGQVIYMKDAHDNEYVVECVKSEKTGFIETNIVSYNNKTLMNEQVNRIEELMGYETPNTYAPASSSVRLNENKGFQDIMDLSRDLIK